MSEMDRLEEDLLLRQFRQVKERGHGDMEISVKDGKLVKLWDTNKLDLSKMESKRIREVL